MGKKVYLVIGLGVGYVLGARAGRKRYDQIKSAATKFWGSEPIQTGVRQVQDLAKDASEQASAALADGAKKLVHAVTEPKPPAKPATKPAARKPAAAATKKPATKPAAKPAATKASTEES